MVFDSQFSLGLEITRLAPINLIAAKTAEAVMNIARDLRVRKNLHPFCPVMILQASRLVLFGTYVSPS